jgi:hypothetical protein
MSQDKSDFYIGYLPKASALFAKQNRGVVITLAIALPIIAFLLVSSQTGYRNSTFELGQLSQVSGILQSQPVPMLKVPLGNNQYQSVLLIGFGKSGARPTIDKIETTQKQSLEGQLVTLEGTLIYYDGKALLELTKKENSFVASNPGPEYQPDRQRVGQATLRGEIMDAKCFFGVMKPGEGKPHKACAANCIAGGIPPTLRTETPTGDVQYLILTGLKGEPINQSVLSAVGEPVKLDGEIERIDDWLFLKIDPQKKINRLHTQVFPNPPMCSPFLSELQ